MVAGSGSRAASMIHCRRAKKGGHGWLSVANARTKENMFQYRLLALNKCRDTVWMLTFSEINGAIATDRKSVV